MLEQRQWQHGLSRGSFLKDEKPGQGDEGRKTRQYPGIAPASSAPLDDRARPQHPRHRPGQIEDRGDHVGRALAAV